MSSDKQPVRTMFASVSRYLAVPESVRLRTESFGGIAFDTLTGTMLELDREAMTMLQHIREAGAVPEDDVIAGFSDHDQVHEVEGHLLSLGMLAIAPLTSLTGGKATTAGFDNDAVPAGRPQGPHLTLPETVHWAIAYRCAQECPDCYARRHTASFADELDTKSAMRAVDILAQWGVFQLAIGGGEPLLRSDLALICDHAHQQDLIVHVTTGYHDVNDEALCSLKGSVGVLQIGVKHEKLLADPNGEIGRLSNTVRKARDMGIRVGANLMLSNTVMAHFDRLVELLAQAGMSGITLLRYKPPADPSRWRLENPSPATWRDFERQLHGVMTRCPGISFRIDCALSFLQRNLKPGEAVAAGIRGCVAGDRILALAPDGSVFPCSQLVSPDLRAGNILADDPEHIWAHSNIMKKYRMFRNSFAFRKGRCGVCGARDHCGGCRVFADDGLGADLGCPESVLSKGDH